MVGYSQPITSQPCRNAQATAPLSDPPPQMRGAMKSNKELDLNFIDKLQDELADMAVRLSCAACC